MSELDSAAALFFDSFVGDEEQRAVTDALLEVIAAAERIADPAKHPQHLKGKGDLAVWMLADAGVALRSLKNALGGMS